MTVDDRAMTGVSTLPAACMMIGMDSPSSGGSITEGQSGQKGEPEKPALPHIVSSFFTATIYGSLTSKMGFSAPDSLYY
jgi:hypothetical protein